MKSICYDSVLLTDKAVYDFFVDDDDELGDRVNLILESSIIKWFFNHRHDLATYLFFEELNIGLEYRTFFDVKNPLIKDNSKPGDIDILLINNGRPELSIAFQVKRIKATVNVKGESILQTTNIEKGIVQTKKQHEKYRFHKSYLMLIIASDAQNHNHDQQMFRHQRYEEKTAAYFHTGYGDLPNDVGIYFLEISQPSKNSIDNTARISSKTFKEAKPVDQLNSTTENIIEFIKSHG